MTIHLAGLSSAELRSLEEDEAMELMLARRRAATFARETFSQIISSIEWATAKDAENRLKNILCQCETAISTMDDLMRQERF